MARNAGRQEGRQAGEGEKAERQESRRVRK
jgi:hypothetical protein